MDENKLKVLKDISYTVQKACGNCAYGDFHQHLFGYCGLHEYQHKKHTGDKTFLSVNQYGICDSHEWSESFVALLGGFAQLMEK